MISKKIYIFVILALVNACTPSNQVTVNPSPSNEPNVLVSASPDANQPNIVLSSSPSQSVNINTSPTPSFPTATPFFSSSPFPTVTSIPTANAFLLSSQEIKTITDSNIVKANNAFGLKLFSEIVKSQEDKDVFISPASVALALQISYNGADTTTKSEMAKTLGIENFSVEEVNNLNKLLLKKLNNPASDISLQVANTLWADQSRVTFKDDYKSALSKSYDTQVNLSDFSNPNTIDLINDWASKSTNGKITEIIDKIPDDIVSYLINAIYFKANWTSTFDKKDTEDKEFILSDGSKKKVPMLSGWKDFSVFRKTSTDTDLKFQAVSLNYGKDKNLSLYMFLPDENSSLEKFYSNLNEENLEKWIKSFYYNQGYISFPKFKTKWDKDLKSNLQNMGMLQAFDLNADFNKMGSSNLGNISISSVIHKGAIDVNEQGTEAVAVTIIPSAAASSQPLPRFVADRPFFYLIRDNETKSILFMGTVNDPKYD